MDFLTPTNSDCRRITGVGSRPKNPTLKLAATLMTVNGSEWSLASDELRLIKRSVQSMASFNFAM